MSEALVQSMIDAVKSYVERATEQMNSRLMARIDEIESGMSDKINSVVASLPKAQDGKDADMEAIQLAIVSAVEAIPKPKDGTDGKDVDMLRVDLMIAAAVDALPKAVNGKDATDEQVCALLKPAMDDAVAQMRALVTEQVSAIPKPKDGESIHPDTVARMVMQEVSRVVSELPKPKNGKDGEPGRDALQIDPLPSMDETRSYPRGTYARHNGGTIHATRTTDPVIDGRLHEAGWSVSQDGLAAVVFTQSEDPRDMVATALMTSGLKTQAAFHVPMLLDKGVWREGEYVQGDVVSWSGSGWIAQCKTSAKPGTGSDWRLAIKAGRDGRTEPPALLKTPPVRLK